MTQAMLAALLILLIAAVLAVFGEGAEIRIDTKEEDR